MNADLFSRTLPTAREADFPTLLTTARSDKSLRISFPVLPSRPLLRGDRAYLRALRAAEMKAWQASGGDAFRPQFAE
jgi:hypothetical protein